MGGSLAQPPFSSFVRILASQEGYADFVETGTYLGETTRWAADVFSRVHTVEINPKFQEQALKTCADRNNIFFLSGGPRSVSPISSDRSKGRRSFGSTRMLAEGGTGTRTIVPARGTETHHRSRRH